MTTAPAGRPSEFRLAQPTLAAAQTVLAATGNAVALCPAWGATSDSPISTGTEAVD